MRAQASAVEETKKKIHHQAPITLKTHKIGRNCKLRAARLQGPQYPWLSGQPQRQAHHPRPARNKQAL